MQYSIVNLSEVKANDWRLDAEYWLPEYLELEKIINEKSYLKLKDFLVSIKNGDDFREYLESGKRYILTGNFDEYGLSTDCCKYIDSNLEPKVKLKVGDILITRKGNYGKIDIVRDQKIENSAISSEVFRLKLKDIDVNFFKIYFQSKYGQKFIERNIHGISNFSITQPALKNLCIPSSISTTLQTAIVNLEQKTFELQQSSQALYKEAEVLLLEELGLLNWKPKHKLWYVKNYSDTIKANRFDAEYFQPKYEEILRRIKKYKGGFVELGQIGEFISGSFVSDEFYSKCGIPYIRIKELSFKGSINKEQITRLNENFTRKNETQVFEGDFIVATIGNTIGKVNLIDKELSGAIPSNNTSKYELKNKEDSFYFQILLQNLVVQKQIEKEYTQTAQPKISNSVLSKIVIPLLPLQTQQIISQKVIESKENDETSKSLLTIAKKAVEMAIEEDEKTAIKFIDSKVEGLKVKIK